MSIIKKRKERIEAMSSSISLYQLSAILLVVTQSIFCDATDKSKDVYIVYMGSLLEGEGQGLVTN
jgi:hypothetical protein